MLNQNMFDMLLPLLKAQSYIHSVEIHRGEQWTTTLTAPVSPQFPRTVLASVNGTSTTLVSRRICLNPDKRSLATRPILNPF